MRLQRYGRKNEPSYRVVVTDSRNSTKTGNHVDVIGSYNPKSGEFTIDGDKAKHWISHGVQVSDTVHNFLVSQKVIEGKKKNALSRKSPIVDEAKIKAEADAKVAAEKAEADAKLVQETAAQEAEAPVDKVNDEVREDALGQETPAEVETASEVAQAPQEEPAPVV